MKISKKLICFIMSALMLVAFPLSAYANEETEDFRFNLNLEDKEIESEEYDFIVIDERVFILFDDLNKVFDEVKLFRSKEFLEIKHGDIKIRFNSEKDTATNNGNVIESNNYSFVEDDIYISISYLANAFDYFTFWNSKTSSFYMLDKEWEKLAEKDLADIIVDFDGLLSASLKATVDATANDPDYGEESVDADVKFDFMADFNRQFIYGGLNIAMKENEEDFMVDVDYYDLNSDDFSIVDVDYKVVPDTYDENMSEIFKLTKDDLDLSFLFQAFDILSTMKTNDLKLGSIFDLMAYDNFANAPVLTPKFIETDDEFIIEATMDLSSQELYDYVTTYLPDFEYIIGSFDELSYDNMIVSYGFNKDDLSFTGIKTSFNMNVFYEEVAYETVDLKASYFFEIKKGDNGVINQKLYENNSLAEKAKSMDQYYDELFDGYYSDDYDDDYSDEYAE